MKQFTEKRQRLHDHFYAYEQPCNTRLNEYHCSNFFQNFFLKIPVVCSANVNSVNEYGSIKAVIAS